MRIGLELVLLFLQYDMSRYDIERDPREEAAISDLVSIKYSVESKKLTTWNRKCITYKITSELVYAVQTSRNILYS